MSSTVNRCLLSIAIVCFLMYFLTASTTIFHGDYLVPSLEGPIEPDHPELLEYIRKEILITPSSEKYNLLGEANPANLAIEESEKFYTNASKVLFQNKTNGFFVEAGALDGESMSNTIELECRQNWKGLLVEADPRSFLDLAGKHRKAWLAHVCLSPHSYPEKLLFATKSEYMDTRKIKPYGGKMRAMNGLASYVSPKYLIDVWFHSTQCLPLESLILALNVKTVDLLSLDVEGLEWKIMQSFSFEKIDIQVIYMEWKNKVIFNTIHEFLKRKGYKLFQNMGDDFIFVKKGSPYDL